MAPKTFKGWARRGILGDGRKSVEKDYKRRVLRDNKN